MLESLLIPLLESLQDVSALASFTCKENSNECQIFDILIVGFLQRGLNTGIRQGAST